MTDGGEDRLLIVGGGLSGCLVALALAELRPDIPFLLIESSERFGGNHVWSFFDPDVSAEHRRLVDPIVARRWDGYDIGFPNRRRTLHTGYSSARSDLLDRRVRDRLDPSRYRTSAPVRRVGHDRVELASGESLAAAAVVDARGFEALPSAQRSALDLAWQKFVGRDYRLDQPHGLVRPIVMDGTVEQIDGYRFVYSLPFADDRLLVEDTYYSLDPGLDVPALQSRLEAYREERGWLSGRVENEEKGVLPVALGGDFGRFWPEGEPGRIGVAGGFFHPTTGYSLPDAVRVAMLIAAEPEWRGDRLAARLRDEARRLWRERGFYRLLNRMLFRAAAPAERYRVLEHFYRLDEKLIGRFYAGRSTLWDKMRILSGKPPVPIRRALAATWR